MAESAITPLQVSSTSTVSGEETPKQTWDYDETLMYGQYSRDLSTYAKSTAQQTHAASKAQRDSTTFRSYSAGRWHKFKRNCVWLRDTVLTKIGEDWIFLTILGVIMALLSYLMDYLIEQCHHTRIWLFRWAHFSTPLQFFTWTGFPLLLICFSTGFVHLVGPNAIGSGIPEMKTILRGVVLKEYLTMRTLVAKIIGLVTSLGCGLPIGKEGPFVHVASIVATLLGKLVTSFRGIYENESRNSEMLAAACAVGVASTFAAPIGGVLFSIEVTSTYFAVRNYWRGFYCAVCGALVFRLLAIVFKREETITALFKTNLRQDFPFDPAELFAFALIGVICGFAGALFVFTHRKFVELIRGQRKLKSFLQTNRFIFPGVVVFIISSLMFPPGFGQYMAGELTSSTALNELFSNRTWSLTGTVLNYEQRILQDHWTGPSGSIFLTLVFFIIIRFVATAMATTLPVPSGVFMPIFTIGAAFGRLVGESMAVWFPAGLEGHPIVPGGYAIVGAAALSGSVTHTISTAVIVFELTGQMTHVLPCVIAVLLATAVAHTLQPSFYDSLIQIKRLPFLPDMINPQVINAHRLFVEEIMVKKVVFITAKCTYREARSLLDRHVFRAFPLVDNDVSRILLGSLERNQLEKAIRGNFSLASKLHFCHERREAEQLTARPADDVAAGRFLSVPLSDDGVPADTPAGSDKKSADASSSDEKPAPSSRFAVFNVEESVAKMEEESVRPKSILKHTTNTNDLEQTPHVHFDSVAPLRESEITEEEERIWVQHQLSECIRFDECRIDPAPFQLVERTSLFKVHSLFSLLSLHHAYVTNIGRLVGIVSLQEVRNAIQGQMQNLYDDENKEDDRSAAPPSDEKSSAVHKLSDGSHESAA